MSNHRAYVGPPQIYDLITAMTFNLLTSLGLRQHHELLDIGCGSLRIGRLLIPYLDVGNYTGIDPNGWLIASGVQFEVGSDQLTIKRPQFYVADSVKCIDPEKQFDVAFAQSIFTHASLDIIQDWLSGTFKHLRDQGILVATFFPGDEDSQLTSWTYPSGVHYKNETMRKLAESVGFSFTLLDWKHPVGQRWALFAKPKVDISWLSNGIVTWNKYLTQGLEWRK